MVSLESLLNIFQKWTGQGNVYSHSFGDITVRRYVGIVKVLTQYLVVLSFCKALKLISTFSLGNNVLKLRKKGQKKKGNYILSIFSKPKMLVFICKLYVRFHIYICSKLFYVRFRNALMPSTVVGDPICVLFRTSL